MKEITITANDAERRLDRFLRKYLPGASLSEIYKIIRKDVKVDSKRRSESYILHEGDVLTLYISDEVFEKFSGGGGRAGAGKSSGAKRSFSIVYEDSQLLIAGKPYGLLTHGDSREKKDHLANQVKDYLIECGSYDPRNEKVFTPAPVNRLDRNTTGIVMFGKTAAAMRELTRFIREDEVRKFYMTIACGVIENEMHLSGSLIKDEASNKVRIFGVTGSYAHQRIQEPGAGRADGGRPDEQSKAKAVETIVKPLEVLRFGNGLTATLCEVELVTGRSHQIRAHLASTGHPLIGDSKYAFAAGSGRTSSQRNAGQINAYCRERFGLSTQLLHAGRIEFSDGVSGSETLAYLAGRAFDAPVPGRFRDILNGLGTKQFIY